MRDDPGASDLSRDVYDHVTMTIRFAIDAVHEVEERFADAPTGALDAQGSRRRPANFRAY